MLRTNYKTGKVENEIENQSKDENQTF